MKQAAARRRFLGTAAGSWMMLASACLQAQERIVLTTSGPAGRPAASFDLTTLQALPATSFTTTTPWYKEPRKFTGVMASDLFKAIGASGATSVRAVALNDYRVDIPADDLVRHGAMLAYLLDDKPMTVREKGPLVIIYPFDSRPEVRDAVHYSRAIWQLRSLELE